MIKRILRMSVYYIIGLILFSSVLKLTQMALLNILGLAGSDIKIFLDNNIATIVIYTVIYVAIYVGISIYDNITIKQLNDSLAKMNERIKMNEEAIRGYSGGNSYGDSGFVRSL